TIDLLMTTAAVGAIAIGASGEAVTVVLLFTLGEALEAYSAAPARASLGGLLALKPAEATVIREHEGHRHYRTVAATQLVPGDGVLGKQGPRIPDGGRAIAGESTVAQSATTGEAVPGSVSAGAADEVFAATINGDGTLEIEAIRAVEDSTIAQI